MWVLSPLKLKPVHSGLDFQFECPRGTKTQPACPVQLASPRVFLMVWNHTGFFPASPLPDPSQPCSVASASFRVRSLFIFPIPPPLTPRAPTIYNLGWWLCCPAPHLIRFKPELGPAFSDARLGLVPESPGSSKHAESRVCPRHTTFLSPVVRPGNLCLPSSLNLRIPLV